MSRGPILRFIQNPVAANLLMVVLLVGGAISASRLQSQVFPTISPGTVTVTVPFPGATPAEVEESITRRVEEAVLGIDGVKRVNSIASENVGTVVIETNDFADRQLVKDDVESAVDRLSDFPPENAEKPVVVAPKPTGGVVTLAVVGDVGPFTLRRAAEQIERDLLTQPGVSLVSLSGDRDYEISIEVSEATLRRYDMTFGDVATAVRQSSLDLLICITVGRLYLSTSSAPKPKTYSKLRQPSMCSLPAILRRLVSRSSSSVTKPACFVSVSTCYCETVCSVLRWCLPFLC